MSIRSEHTQRNPTGADRILDPETVDAILAAVASLRYGVVEVTVHDGRVVQLDRRERIRLTPS